MKITPQKIWIASFVAYFLMGIFTYGHAYIRTEKIGGSQFLSSDERSFATALSSSAFWPLYWSIQLHRKLQ